MLDARPSYPGTRLHALPRIAAVLFAAWRLACWPALAGAALPGAAADPWVEVRSARFVVCSNAGEAAATRVARHLERLAQTLERTTTGFRVDGGRDVRVFVFRDRDSYVPYSPFREAEGRRTAGFHTSGSDAEYIAFWVPAKGPDLTFPAHEYLHAVVSRSFGYLPTWVNEGLADLYSTFQPRGRSVVIGAPPLEHLVWLRGHHMPIAQLLAETNESPDYERGSEHTETLYAESWALTHMLFFDPLDHGRHFSHLLGEMAHGVTGLTALTDVYGANAPDSLLKAVLEYTRTSVRASERTFETDLATVPVRTRALSPAEAGAALGELLARSRQQSAPLAQEHLAAAWAADSSRAVTAALLGDLAEREGDLAGAARWFAVLDRPGVQDPRACGLAGAALAQRRLRASERYRWPATGADSLALRARALLARALQAKPDEAAWLVPYAITFLDDTTDFAMGIGALIQARESHPDTPEIEGATAMLQLRAGNRGAALHAYGRIPRGENHDYWRASAGHLVAEATLAEAATMARAGHADDAESLVTELQHAVTERGVPARCTELLAWLRDLRASQQQAPSPATGVRRGGARASGGSGAAAPRSTPASRAAREAEARNQRRLQSAEALERSGAMSEACALYALILADSPRPELKREAEKRRARLCR